MNSGNRKIGQAPCGCDVLYEEFGKGKEGRTYGFDRIKFCPKHEAADEMLELLKRILVSELEADYPGFSESDKAEPVRALIAKAEVKI